MKQAQISAATSGSRHAIICAERGLHYRKAEPEAKVFEGEGRHFFSTTKAENAPSIGTLMDGPSALPASTGGPKKPRGFKSRNSSPGLSRGDISTTTLGCRPQLKRARL